MSLVKLKQIEQGAAIAAAILAAHPAATLTNNAAPFAFDPVTQVGNIPQDATFAVAGNTITYTPGNGGAPVVFTPTFPQDVFLQSGTYNAATGNLELTLSDASVVLVPVSALVPIITGNTQTVTLTGDGTPGTPLNAAVNFSAAAGNLAANDGTGVFVSLTVASSPTVAVTGNGTPGQPLTAAAVIDPAVNNALVATAQGLYVAPSAGASLANSETVKVRGTGSGVDPYKFDVKLQGDGPAAPNFIHAPASAAEDNDNENGLGYSVVQANFTGVGPFNLTSAMLSATSGWVGTPDIARVHGYVNGVRYQDNSGGFNLSSLAAVTWGGVAGGADFDLEANDEIRFDLHVRAQ